MLLKDKSCVYTVTLNNQYVEIDIVFFWFQIFVDEIFSLLKCTREEALTIVLDFFYTVVRVEVMAPSLHQLRCVTPCYGVLRPVTVCYPLLRCVTPCYGV